MEDDYKTNRKNFRFTDQIKNCIEDLAEKLGKSESEVAAIAIFNLYNDNKAFIVAPNGEQWWLKEEVPDTNPITEFQCKDGSKFWFDWDKDKIIKTKPAK